MPPRSPRVPIQFERRYAVALASLVNRFSLAINRDLRRAALFLWTTPLPATRSSILIASVTAVAASAWSPPAIAVSALRTKVRAADLYGRFRCRRRSETRIRFSADFVFAKTDHPSRYVIAEGMTLPSVVSATPAPAYQKPGWGSRSGDAETARHPRPGIGVGEGPVASDPGRTQDPRLRVEDAPLPCQATIGASPRDAPR